MSQSQSKKSGSIATTNLTRRQAMRGLAGGAAAVGAGSIGIRQSSQEAEAIAPLAVAGYVGFGLVSGAVGGVAFGASISGPDDAAVDGALGYQNHLQEYTRAREDELILDQTISSLQRDVQLVQNKAREEAIFRVYEQGVDSGSEADAESAAEQAIDEAYATVQRSILDTWKIRYNRYKELIGTELVPEGSDTVLFAREADNPTNTYTVGDGADSYTFENSGGIRTITLFDGSTIDIPITYENDFDSTIFSRFDPTRNADSSNTDVNQLAVSPPEHENYDGVDEDTHDFNDPVVALDTGMFSEAYSTLEDEYDTMIDEVQSIIDSYYQPAADGEIDLHEAVGPRHLTDTASNAADYQEGAMALRAMGYPMADQATEISISSSESEVESDLLLLGRLSWTAHNGGSLEVGAEINPDNIPGSIYGSFNMPDDVESAVEIVELTEPFTIESAEGASEVTFEDRELASADEITDDEVVQIYRDNFDADREATDNVHDTATGGGGGFLDGLDNRNSAVAAVVAAILVAIGVLGN